MGNFHIDKNGVKMKISELTDSHLINIIKMIKRKSKEGLFFGFGCGSEPESFHYDFEEYYGDEVKEKLNYKSYKKEAKKRNLKY